MQPSILVPLDGSPPADLALPHAGRLARALRAHVVLLHVRAADSPGSGPDLRAGAERLRAEGVTVEARETLIPSRAAAGYAIVKMTEGMDGGLVVMATRSRGGLGRLILGSIADQVVRQSTLPVLLISDGCRTAWPTHRPLSILVPLDGSPQAEHAIGVAAALAEEARAALHLVRVVRVPDRAMYNYSLVFLNVDPEAELEEARAYLAGIADRLRATGRMVTTHALIGTPGYAVADVARDLDVDMIAMSTHGRSGLDRHLMGSVATDTVRRARRPILIVGPAALGRSGLGAASETASAVTSQDPAPVVQGEIRSLPVGGTTASRQ
ncbi:MAG: universal stress protein [Chloroflexi bacterium]|nr:universal stress protein [Chloroflexota bacterium]